MILSLSNVNLTKNDEKGLIVDFSLEDIRKLKKRENRMNSAKTESKRIQKEKNNQAKLRLKPLLEKLTEKGKKLHEVEINTIKDPQILRLLYNRAIRRERKRKIKRRLREILPDTENLQQFLNSYSNEAVNGEESKEASNDYVVMNIEDERTNINKKFKKIRQQNRQEKSLLKKKRRRGDNTD